MSVFTVDLKNQPGELARPCEAMAGRGINLVLSAAARAEEGTVVFIADDETACRSTSRSPAPTRHAIPTTPITSTFLPCLPGTWGSQATTLGYSRTTTAPSPSPSPVRQTSLSCSVPPACRAAPHSRSSRCGALSSRGAWLRPARPARDYGEVAVKNRGADVRRAQPGLAPGLTGGDPRLGQRRDVPVVIAGHRVLGGTAALHASGDHRRPLRAAPSAQVQVSRTANQQVSAVRPSRTRDREPTQVTCAPSSTGLSP